MNPLVTIITPLYNASPFIKETIQSVKDQTFKDWEWIIVDDCSTDSSVEIVNSCILDDSRVHLIRLAVNSGTGIAKNTALRHARGRFIAFIDSDDLWMPDKLELQVDFMMKNNYPISFTSYIFMDKSGRDTDRLIQVKSSLNQHQYLKNTIIGFSTSMIDKDIIGSFEFIALRSREDTHLWITLLGKGFIAYGLGKVLTRYRLHDHSITSNKLKAARQTWELYNKTEKLGFFRSVYYFGHYAVNALKKHYL
jgi:teichuronic acid biosynthesis glycosyltransferase TuaG